MTCDHEANDPPGSPALHVVLVAPEIAPNAGNVSRTCVGIDAMLWLVRPLGFEITDRHLRRAGLDYWPRLRWSVVDGWPELETALAGRRFWLFSAHAPALFTMVRYRPGDVLVFGSESRGLPVQVTRGREDRLLRIPIHPGIRSLNLSNAVAIGAYEAMRQIHHWSDAGPGLRPGAGRRE